MKERDFERTSQHLGLCESHLQWPTFDTVNDPRATDDDEIERWKKGRGRNTRRAKKQLTRSTCTRVIFFAFSLPSSLYLFFTSSSSFTFVLYTIDRLGDTLHRGKKCVYRRESIISIQRTSRTQNKLPPLFFLPDCISHFQPSRRNETSNAHPQSTICVTRSCETRRGSKLHTLFERHTLRTTRCFIASVFLYPCFTRASLFLTVRFHGWLRVESVVTVLSSLIVAEKKRRFGRNLRKRCFRMICIRNIRTRARARQHISDL